MWDLYRNPIVQAEAEANWQNRLTALGKANTIRLVLNCINTSNSLDPRTVRKTHLIAPEMLRQFMQADTTKLCTQIRYET